MKDVHLNQNNEHIEKLILACQKKDQKAQMKLYQNFSQPLYHVAYRILKDPDDALDAMQEGFITAFEKLDQYQGSGNFGGWLHKIVARKSIEWYHKKKPFVHEQNFENKMELSEYQEENESSFTLGKNQLEMHLNQLPKRYQLILKMYYLEGFDHEEISEILNISYANSRTLLSRAKTNLKERIK